MKGAVKSIRRVSKFASAAKRAEQAITSALTYVGQPVATGVVQDTPIETGALRETVRPKVEGKTLIVKAGNTEEGGDVDYALPVHQGTYKMQGRPYLVNGVNRDGQMILDRIASDVEAALV